MGGTHEIAEPVHEPTSLDQAFPSCEILNYAAEPTMPGWERLLTCALEDVGPTLAKLLGLRAGSTAAELVGAAEGVALLVPVEERRRSGLRFRALAVDLACGPRLLFSGIEYLLPFDWPPDVRRVISRLGPVAIGAGAELFVDDGTEADELMATLEAAGCSRPVGLLPFYCDSRGARSCWVGGDASHTWLFDPDIPALEPESDGGFPGWFSHRLRVEVARAKGDGTDHGAAEVDVAAEVEQEMARHPELDVEEEF